MSLTYISMIFSYWIFLTGAVFVAGAFTARIFVTSPSGADLCLSRDSGKCLGESAIRVVFVTAIFTLVANIIHLVFHASVMTETPLKEVSSIITLFLTKTKYGKFTLMRTVLTMLIVGVSALGVRKSSKTVDILGAAISLALLVTISMSGHKGAGGYFSMQFAMAVIHIISITLWIGGVFFIFKCYSFLIQEAGGALWAILKSMITRFSTLATVCVTVAVISGTVLSLLSIKSFEQLTVTTYGLTLVAKVMLVCLILIMGAANKFYIVPMINSIDVSDEESINFVRRRLAAFITVEAYVGIGVLLATAVLTHLSPEG